jgi:cold shock CspA family protein
VTKIRGNRARLLIALLVGCLVPLVGLGAVGAAPVTATAIRFDSIQTPGVTVPPTADAPAIWVAADTPFTVTATAVDSTGAPAPFSFTKDTTVSVTAVTPAGPVNLGSVVVLKEQTTFSFSRTLTNDIDDAFLHLQTVEAKKMDPVRQGDSGTFDVQREFNQSDAATTPDVAIGGVEQGADCTPSIQEKICFEVHLPQGTATGNHLLSIGNCDAVNPCRQATDYWWSLVNVVATRDNPAYVDMGLDKSLKGIVFENGVPKVKWVVRASGATVWVEAPACPSKGVIGADQEFCHDVTNGHRDNSGDTWVRLLWLRDIRGSIK